jgi:predicted porin
MKKQLLGTSAIALGIAMAAPASAQEWNMKWGGFARTHVGIVDLDADVTKATPAGSDFEGVNTFTDSEIIFSPSVTLDNGMTFGFSVQFEAVNSASGTPGNIDENYVTITSDTLGQIILGNENSAGYKSIVAAPQVGSMPINSRSISAFIPITGSGGFRQAALSTFTEVEGNNDVPRITYFTPSFNGLTLGVSYAPSGDVNAANNGPVDFDEDGGLRDIFDIGLKYSQSFNGVDVNIGARWGTGERQGSAAGSSNDVVLSGVDGTLGSTQTLAFDADSDGLADAGDVVTTATAATSDRDPETWGIGGSVAVSGFTFGAAYVENDTDAGGGVGDQEGLNVGVAYDLAGPWTVGLEGYFGEVDEGAGNSDSEYDAIKLAASRKLGAGVSWDVYYVYAESSNKDGDEIEGNLFATAINLSF